MTTLYRLFDAKNQLLYIGIANRWTSRLGNHAHDKPWWDEVAKTTVEHFPTREAALSAEARAIRTEHPAHNVIHNGRAKPAPATKVYEFEWLCQICHRPIADNDGYLEAQYHWPNVDHNDWWFVHRPCDPNTSTSFYWIGVERIRTNAHVYEWLEHLSAKRWFDEDRWLRALNIADAEEARL